MNYTADPKHDETKIPQQGIDQAHYYVPSVHNNFNNDCNESGVIFSPENNVCESDDLETNIYSSEEEIRNCRDVQSKQSQSTHFIVVQGSGGGYGTSTLCLKLAYIAQLQGLKTCVIDCDYWAGGIDILLGCEEQEGLRWHNVQAPLGTIDYHNFDEELISYDGIFLLPNHSWQSRRYQWWEMKAVYEAVARNCDVVIIDCGIHRDDNMSVALQSLALPIVVHPVVLAKLTTMSMARCVHIVSAWSDEEENKKNGVSIRDVTLFIAKTKHTTMSQRDIENYLHTRIFGIIPYNSLYAKYEARGWGLPHVSKYEKTLLGSFVSEL